MRASTLLVAFLGLWGLGCRPPSHDALAKPVVLRLLSAGSGESFLPLIAQVLKSNSAGFDVTIQRTTGSVANVSAIQEDRADIATAYSDVAYLAYTGRLEGETEPFDQLRAIAVIRLDPFMLVTRTSSDVTNLEELRGKHLGISSPIGSGTAMTVSLFIKTLDLRPSTVQIEEVPNVSESLKTGGLDAIFDRGTFSPAVAEAVRSGAKLIPIGGRSIDVIQNEYPFLRKTVIPRGRYPGAGPIPTVGVDIVLVCRRTIDERLIYEFTARMFEAIPSLPASVRGSMVEFEEMSATTIPLHEGAARYFREQALRR